MSKLAHLIVGVSAALLLFAPRAAHADASVPDGRGPFTISSIEYDAGDEALRPDGFPGPVEVRASVHYPENLSEGPFPLVFVMHGRSTTCLSATGSALAWPCPAGYEPRPSYRGFDYLAEILASHGLIVVSMSANGINAADNSTPDQGMRARAALIDHHLSLWESFNAGTGPVGNLFAGAVDTSNVGTMGHSRGGEGVVQHYLRSRDERGASPVKAVLALAPTNTKRALVSDVPLGVMLPYCDGDLSGLPGVYYFDDAVYQSESDEAPKYTFLMMGANHNYYNTRWGSDDWRRADYWRRDEHCDAQHENSQRLSPEQQRSAALPYVAAFFRQHLLGETRFSSILTGDESSLPATMQSSVHASFHPPASDRLMVNRVDLPENLSVNGLGGSVDAGTLTRYEACGGAVADNNYCLDDRDRNLRQAPHNYPLFGVQNTAGLTQLSVAWTDAGPDAWVENTLPPPLADVSAFDYLQFRAGVNFELSTAGQNQDFYVELRDGNGLSDRVRVGSVSDALFYPPGTGYDVPTPRNVLNTVRVPLAQFAGIDLSDVRSVRLVFDATDGGALLLTDLAFTARASTEPPGDPPEPVIPIQWCLGSD